MVKADGHVRIRHESLENGQRRIRHESKEKGAGISYIEVDSRDKDNLIPFYDLDNLPQLLDGTQCLKEDGSSTPTSENSCSCQSNSPESSTDETSQSSNTSSRNSKTSSDCDICSSPLIKRESPSVPAQNGACNIVPDDSVDTCCNVPTSGDDATTPLCSCDNCTDCAGDAIPSSKSCNLKDPWFKRGYHYDFAVQAPGPTDHSHLAPTCISSIQCPDNGSYKNLKSDLFVCVDELSRQKQRGSSRRQCLYHIFVLALLLMANLLNYMDRYTIAGNLFIIKFR